jgi:HAD superfamily hydrolase (TIGR01490 family)
MRAAAFFDIDCTLLAVNSGALWLRELRRRREISVLQALRAIVWLVEYRLALVDMDVVTARVGELMAGGSEAELRARCERWFAEEVARFVTPGAVATLEEHRRQGHVLVILSGSSAYTSQPLATLLDIPHILCTRLEVENGRFTGRMVPPVCFGRGKVTLAEEFAREHEVDLAKSWFYSDSYSDLPMLERVGYPVAVNPDPRLSRHAHRVRWPICHWRV